MGKFRVPATVVLSVGFAVLAIGWLAFAQGQAEWQDAKTNPIVSCPGWLPEGAVLWASVDGMAKLSGSGSWQLLPLDGSIVPASGPLVAPGGRHVAILMSTDAGDEVRLIETSTWRVIAATREQRPLLLWGKWGAWSPDGLMFCFSVQDKDTPVTAHLETLKLDGTTEALTKKGNHLDCCPGFVSQSQMVFNRIYNGRTTETVRTSSGPANISEILFLNMLEKRLSSVTTDHVDRAPTVSENGKVSFIRLDSHNGQVIYLGQVAADSIFPLIGDVLSFPVSSNTSRGWTDSGSRIIVHSGNALYAVSIPSGELSKIAIGDPVDPQWAISPDGTKIAYSTRGRGCIFSMQH